jgi:hypothetical protein
MEHKLFKINMKYLTSFQKCEPYHVCKIKTQHFLNEGERNSMKTMRNALNITADNHELVKAGYIQLPVPITITEEWLNSPSLLYKEETNRERLLYDLRACGITDTDFGKLIGKTIYSVPDDSIYNAYLEVTRLDKLDEHEDMVYEDIQKYLSASDAYVEQMTEVYSRFSEMLVDRVWNYYLFKEQVKLDRLMHAYKEMVAECTVQTLLFILVNTPNFGLGICFKNN